MKRNKLFGLALILSIPPTLSAGEFLVPAGKWQSTVTTTNSFMPTPVTRTHTECRKETRFDPAEMMKEAQECELTDQNVNGNVLTFTIVCRTQEGDVTGNGRYELMGDRLEGRMDMKMNAGGQPMDMNMKFSGQRLGDC